MQKEYRVTLSPEERDDLSRLVAAGKAAARALVHARIPLKADQADGGPAWEDARIAEAPEVGQRTAGRARQRFVEPGLPAALGRKKQDRPSRPRKLDGRAEARLSAVACSAPPEGRQGWAMRLLADQLVESEVVGAVSGETVRRVLKKTRSSRG